MSNKIVTKLKNTLKSAKKIPTFKEARKSNLHSTYDLPGISVKTFITEYRRKINSFGPNSYWSNNLEFDSNVKHSKSPFEHLTFDESAKFINPDGFNKKFPTDPLQRKKAKKMMKNKSDLKWDIFEEEPVEKYESFIDEDEL